MLSVCKDSAWAVSESGTIGAPLATTRQGTPPPVREPGQTILTPSRVSRALLGVGLLQHSVQCQDDVALMQIKRLLEW